LVPADLPSKEREALLDSLRHMIPERYNVRHVTLQLEESAECCEETHMPGVIAAHIGAGAGRRRHHHEERS
jgi:hypothetical protein